MRTDDAFHGLVGSSPRMRALYAAITDVASVQVPVLIYGESGTGKELVAHAIHAESDRSDRAFHPVNTGAIPQELIASELFGHEKGAFTGATRQRVGMFEASEGGTVFLDEVSSMDEQVQVSLLRFLETRRFTRVGGTTEHDADVRILTATNTDLATAVSHGHFRKDLFYRLNVFPIRIPPLRERGDDIDDLVHFYLRRFADEFGREVRGITPSALDALRAYPWPGNVRQLSNVMIRLVVSAGAPTIAASDVAAALRHSSVEPPPTPPITTAPGPDSAELSAGTSIADAERTLIRNTLAAPGMSRTEAAKLLGISRKALYNKIRQYEIDKD